MSVTSPQTEARLAFNAIVNTEFTPEAFVVLNDKLHESLGNTGTRLGTSPIRSRPMGNNRLVMVHQFFFQFYGKWNEDIDPNMKIDPAKMEGYAERLLRAIENANKVGTERVWYFAVDEVNYPDDPTGNKTRFEMTVSVYGNNSSLVETSG